ncbi:fimbria/pilus outer membrane usher protein [Ralstonia insidiosa]|uniref:Fimbrial biogenesis outer membrane usher protein n=1 Tax=Ralstonia insidiosa TaxID=190721 RepID=A0A848P221_9RALS|nr:fimbria/pilus outer membrane usher protein [Ralstonia insidiosa]NMV41362.1 fimbrial biogenesis outer membrane usher protein [Ralstonia insidiosa]
MKLAPISLRSLPQPFTLTKLCVSVLLALGTAERAMAQTASAIDAAPASLSGDPTALQSVPAASSAPVEFNSDFLSPQAGSVDVSRYERGNPVLPGSYRVELTLNGHALGRTDITVKPGTDPQRGRICMTRTLLDQIGLNWSIIDAAKLAAFEDPSACPVLEALVPSAYAELDTGELRLNLSLPQSTLLRTPRGYVNPALWDKGATAGMLGYTFNAYRTDASGTTNQSIYLGVNSGFNVGDWHVRHNGALSQQTGSGSTYQAINTYAERDLASISGRLRLGDGNTSGEVFDTVPFRGAQLASDDRMLPDSQRGYAPVVRGIAETNARVTIRQRGIVLYDTPVSPGPFVIDDLYPTGYGGNLDVTVTEADGRVRMFSVPYAAVAQLLRPDTSRYSLTAGTLRGDGLSFTPKFVQGTYQRGLTNQLTAYGGVQANDRYTALLGGLALGTPVGALSLDLTGARTQLDSGTSGGASVRVGYSKLFEQTGSNVSIAAYRFSTSGFMDVTNAMQTIDAERQGMAANAVARPRSRLSLTLSQPLGERWGQFFLSGYTQNYWNAERKDVQFQLGYSNQFRSVAYSVSANRVRNANGSMDTQFMFNVSLPLGNATQAPRLGVNVTSQPGQGTAAQTTLSGVAGSHNEFSYGTSVTNNTAGNGMAGTVNGQYVAPRTTVQAGFGMGSGYRNATFGLSGSVVAHPDGITLSPYTGDTLAVVAAPDAAGARVLGYSNVQLDGRGYAVVPYLTPYRMNEIAIDPKGLSTDVELKTTSQQVAPHAGAVVMMRYATVTGRAVLVDATQPDGTPLPFGADVTDADGNSVGAVGQGGRAFIRLQQDQTDLTIRWGDAPTQQCKTSINLPPRALGTKADAMDSLTAACLPQVQ